MGPCGAGWEPDLDLTARGGSVAPSSLGWPSWGRRSESSWATPTPTPRRPRSPAAWPRPPPPRSARSATHPTLPSILGSGTDPPANPTSTLVTPPGGVANFTATSTNLYVITGSQLITYTLSGSRGGLVRPAVGVHRLATRSPNRSSTRRGTSTCPATTGRRWTSYPRPDRCCGRSIPRAATPPASSRWAPARGSS